MAAGTAKPTSRKGRPNYRTDYKLQVAQASCEPGISVAKLAQSHGLNPNMVFKWRRQLRAGLLGSVLRREVTELLPISVVAEPGREVSVTTTVPTPQAIEIELNGARVRVVGMVDPTQLRLVLRCLMPA